VRRALTPAVTALLFALAGSSLWAAKAPTKIAPLPPGTVVYLNGAADLEQLRESNFQHYLVAKRILAAANVLCRSGAPRPLSARFDGADPHCAAFLWKTSLPPKKELTFHLDGVQYIALIAVMDLRARAVPLTATAP